MLQDSRVNPHDLHNTYQYHEDVADLMLKKRIDTSRIRALIEEANEDAAATSSVLKAFLKGWIKKNRDFVRRINVHEQTLIYGELMLEFGRIINVLNAESGVEQANLTENYAFLNVSTSNCKYLVYSSHLLGRVFIGYGVVLVPSRKFLWDRNMTLMIKDMCVARFHSCMALQYPTGSVKEDTEDLITVLSVYKSGDDLMRSTKNGFYKTIKLIEPICSHRLAQLAAAHRDKIPEFESFGKHIRNTIRDVVKENPNSTGFLTKLMDLKKKSVLLSIYGMFRHWGHPFINYMEGLKKLHQNVSGRKNIDKGYCELLASDLAFKILSSEFTRTKRWFVSSRDMPANHIMYEHIVNNTWPTPAILQEMEGKWHKLTLLKCWDIPDVVDPSLLYSDKSHSITRSELVSHLTHTPNQRIKGKKVLETLLNTPETNWPEFLQRVNDHGIDPDQLIIGLKMKEREVKEDGRCFSLMGWDVRQYIVFTEYLVKDKILPLFKGLTMADDQNTLIKKMMENSSGQGRLDYKEITIANHLDYEKWNNH